jgi:HD-like signal output (HDOD) protein
MASPSPIIQSADEQARRVEAILSRVEAFPALSGVATRLLTCQTAADADMVEVVRMIESDPALATRLLGLCRRADRGNSQRINTVKRAVLQLGFDAVKAAALSVSACGVLNPDVDSAMRAVDGEISTRGDDGLSDMGGPLSFDRNGFWKHSVAVACCTEVIAQMHPRLGVGGPEAFLAGLLHGVGKFVLDFALPRSYGAVVRLARQRGCRSAEAERQLIGVDYFTAGHHLAEHWGLPDAVCNVAWLHGLPVAQIPGGMHRSLVLMVLCAKEICEWMHLGWSGEFTMPRDPVGAWRDSGFDWGAAGGSGKLDVVYTKLFESVADRFELLSLSPRTPTGIAIESVGRANQGVVRVQDALELRRQATQSQNRGIEVLERFISRALTTELTFAGQAARVLRNAAEAMGGGRHALLIRRSADSNWQRMLWPNQPGRADIAQIETLPDPSPTGRVGQWLSQPKMDTAQINVQLSGLMDWMAGVLGPEVPPLSLKAMHLTPTGSPDVAASVLARTGLRVILVSDREIRSERAMGAANPAALISAWYQALHTAASGDAKQER